MLLDCIVSYILLLSRNDAFIPMKLVYRKNTNAISLFYRRLITALLPAMTNKYSRIRLRRNSSWDTMNKFNSFNWTLSICSKKIVSIKWNVFFLSHNQNRENTIFYEYYRYIFWCKKCSILAICHIKNAFQFIWIIIIQ